MAPVLLDLFSPSADTGAAMSPRFTQEVSL